MTRPLRIQYPGAYYHITCRGIERRGIFNDDADRSRFLVLLAGSLRTYQVLLHAYVMMANHFHLLIQTKKANCSEFMRHFNICYTSWFNWRHHRCGNLYQGRYKAFLVDADNYLLAVSRYLHLNPVRVIAMESQSFRERWQHAQNYQWSSLSGYTEEQRRVHFIKYNKLLSMAGGHKGYTQFIVDGLKQDINNPFQQIYRSMILGDEDFIIRIKQYIHRASKREQPEYSELQQQSFSIDPVRLLKIIMQTCGIEEKILHTHHRYGIIRGMVAEFLYRYCEITQKQIGHYLGNIDYISVHMLRKRLHARIGIDAKLKNRFEELETKIKEIMYNEKI